MRANKLPKNFIALDIARKHAETMKNPTCTIHSKEMLRYFCISCEKPICAECIIDHSGHEFVRREESCFVIKETAANIKKILDES